jgi:hypothetical protein
MDCAVAATSGYLVTMMDVVPGWLNERGDIAKSVEKLLSKSPKSEAGCIEYKTSMSLKRRQALTC